jgi:hypothetical protein
LIGFSTERSTALYLSRQVAAERVAPAISEDAGQSKALSHFAGQDEKWLHFKAFAVRPEAVDVVVLFYG